MSTVMNRIPPQLNFVLAIFYDGKQMMRLSSEQWNWQGLKARTSGLWTNIYFKSSALFELESFSLGFSRHQAKHDTVASQHLLV